MKRLKEILKSKKGLRILDIGTGAGGFIYTIIQLTDNFEEIIGIDTSERAIEAANKNFEDERINFVKMDALNMNFEDESFDIVCLSNSLHHLEDVRKTISEMERVLKSDGFLLFNEMYSDVENQMQLTHVEIHHFWAEIDRLNNVVHNETMTRQEIIDTLNDNSRLKVNEAWDMEREEQEFTKENYDWLKNTLKMSLDKVKDSGKYEDLKKKADILEERIEKIGFKSATQLLVVMK